MYNTDLVYMFKDKIKDHLTIQPLSVANIQQSKKVVINM